MATYVVSIRREARSDTMTAEEWVRQVLGVHVNGAGNPWTCSEKLESLS